MRINKIKLNNIRSYLDEEINFPEGSLLLSGDIGSGKSTILLAIEFALFGLQKGALSGSSLLRNGEEHGFVELYLNIGDKEVIIKKGLRRNGSISQDSGYIIIDGVKKEGTTTELKQIILELLNYPKEFLTKSKGLIYRYTVYTPQEEMKHILLGDKEIRLDVLRRIFNIDKYKRIRENVKVFATGLREKEKELIGRISDLEIKKNEKRNNEIKLKEILQEIKTLKPRLEELNKEILKKKKEILSIEDKVDLLNNLRRDFVVNEADIRNKSKELINNKTELDEIDEQIIKLRNEVNVGEISFNEEELTNKEENINIIQQEINNLKIKINNFKVSIDNSNKIINDISKLSICPLCKQDVNDGYKNQIIENEKSKVDEYLPLIKNNEEQLIILEDKLMKLKRELNYLMEKKILINKIQVKNENLNRLMSQGEKLLKLQDNLNEEINKLSSEKNRLVTKFGEFKSIEEDYTKEKKELERLQGEGRIIEIKNAGFEKEKENLELSIIDLENEIEVKLRIKENINYLSQLRFWLNEHFIRLMEVIEKQVMLRVHNDFCSLFEKWFSTLVEDKNIKITLDEEFSPKIEQNGYDIEYEYLSGGEKTAAALAYRLALNQVINTLIADLNTRDLLILDEPTDGFSDEQLDRVKMVLDELDIKQVILVSHESKIESFVDNVISLNKENHISKVM